MDCNNHIRENRQCPQRFFYDATCFEPCLVDVMGKKKEKRKKDTGSVRKFTSKKKKKFKYCTPKFKICMNNK